MKSVEEFKPFYNSTLLPVLEQLEAERKKMFKIIGWYAVAVVALLLIMMIVNLSNGTPLVDVVAVDGQGNPLPGQPKQETSGGINLIFFLGLGGVLGYFFWFKPKRVELGNQLKNEITNKIAKFADERLHFDLNKNISQGEYQQSKMFVKPVGRYASDGVISGTLGETAIRFSPILAEEKVSTDDSNNPRDKGVTYETIFKGILFVADFNKHFNGRTVVVTDEAERKLGSLGTFLQKMNPSRDTLIKLDNIEFEKLFAVHGTDQVEAHYILSHSLMERIVELRKKAGLINLSFVGSHIYIAIPAGENLNLFEPRFYKTLITYQPFSDYYRYMLLAVSIVEALNLNTRIWTKE